MNSEEQLRAINADGPRIAIRAGAGAGKTRVLVERYLNLIVKRGADPDEILAITFTRKAAADMKRRIVRALREAGLHAQAQRAQVGPISTVDAFCERLLREYPFDAGVDPQFEMLSESAATELRHACAARALAALSEDEDVQLTIRTFGGQAGWNEAIREISHGLAGMIDGVLNKMRTAGQSQAKLLEVCDSIETVRAEWREYCNSILRETFGDEYREDMLENPPARKKPSWLKTPNEVDEVEAARIARGMSLLVADTWRRLVEEFEVRRQMDFSEVATRACNMLEESGASLIGKYRWLLVDESQDLNPLQHRILAALPVQSVLHVGDPQQSIYGFRGAERKHFIDFIESAHCEPLRTNWRSTPGLLHGVERIFQNIWQSEYLSMKPRETQDSSDPFEQGSIDGIEVWHVGEAQEMLVADGVKALVEGGEKPDNIAILMHSGTPADNIVRRLNQYGIKAAIHEIRGNYFLRNEIRDLGCALVALADPTDDLAVLSLLRSPLVGVSLDGIAKLGIQSKATGGVINAMGGFDGSEADGQRLRAFADWFMQLSARCDTMPAWQVLAEVLTATDADARFAMLPGRELLVANARKLISQALDRRHMGPLEFGKWVANQQQQREKMGDATSLSEGSAAVLISTMHSAKGLEWDVVIALLNFWKPPPNKLEVIPERGLITLGASGRDTVAFAAAKTQKMARELEEERRLLYVALTRARRKLCIAIPHKEFSKVAVWEDVRTALAPRGNPIPGVTLRAPRLGDFANPPSE